MLGNLKENEKWAFIFSIGVILVFFLGAMYFAVNVGEDVYPDEQYHLQLSQIYADEGFSPENSERSYWMGDITRRPPVYHAAMGAVLSLTGDEDGGLYILRFVNVIFATLTVVIAVILGWKLFKEPFVRFIPALLLAGTPLYLFLAGAVNYDNLANLLIAASILCLVTYVQTKKLWYVPLMWLFLGLGGLVKYTVLPLYIPFWVITLAYLKPWKGDLLRGYLSELSRSGITIAIAVAASVMLIFVGLLYGGNLLRYGGFVPSCTEVMTEEECSQSPLYIRDEEMKQENSDIGRMSPIIYSVQWVKIMTPQIFGFTGHEKVWPEPVEIAPIAIAVIVAGACFVFTLKKVDGFGLSMLGVAVFYLLVLVYYQNYRGYLQVGNIFLAVQGRYIFPVILPIYLLVAQSISLVSKRNVMKLAAIVIVACYLCMNVIMFRKLLQVDSNREMILVSQTSGNDRLISLERSSEVE